jgi:DNA invertase Pin-like site-specific DNA recombinase
VTGKRIGYIRVSTVDQNPDRQLEGVQLDKKFIDYASAKSTNRPELKAMLEFIREDDTIIVHSMDRLARNLKDLKSLVDGFLAKKIKVNFIKESLLFSGENSAQSNLILNLMGAFAEFEYAFIIERQREGVEIAKKNGKYKGTPKKMTPEKIEELKRELLRRHEDPDLTKSQIAINLGISRWTMYRCIHEIAKERAKAL